MGLELENSRHHQHSVTSEDPMIGPDGAEDNLADEAKELELEKHLLESGTCGKAKVWQRRLWRFLDDPSSSWQAKYLSVFIMFVIAVSVLNFTFASVSWPGDCETVGRTVNVTLLSTSLDVNVTTTVETLSWEPMVVCKKLDEDRSPYAEIEYFCIIVFTIEFFLRICSCSADAGLLRFCVSIMNVVDLLAIMPWWVMSIQTWTNSGSSDSLKALAVLRVLRLTRVMRVFKMSRNFTGLILLGQTFKKSASALVMLFLFVMMSLVVFATLMFNAESGTWDPVRLQFVRDDGQPSPFESIPRTMWWCIVTMTTVGYGDDTPITVAGYLIATVCMFVGLVILALPITIIGANFDELYREMHKKEHLRKQKLRELFAEQQLNGKGKSGGAGLRRRLTKGAKVGGGDVQDPETHEDKPLMLIQDCMRAANVRLADSIEELMKREEERLRREIKEVLDQYISTSNSPLDAKRATLAGTVATPRS